jgi:hypothetical protein
MDGWEGCVFLINLCLGHFIWVANKDHWQILHIQYAFELAFEFAFLIHPNLIRPYFFLLFKFNSPPSSILSAPIEWRGGKTPLLPTAC